MLNKILIANRGEIAVRIIKTARKMGLATVAVCSEADKSGMAASMADEVVLIGPAAAADSYLRADKIIDACLKTGADCVHPGYGFLSENADFARALTGEGIAFVGPNLKAIEVMGDKIASKEFAEKAGVNTVPGFPGVIETADKAVQVASQIGFPVMIKASAGGGGKGMRIAWSAEEVPEGFSASQNEAKSSFGDDRIFIEKYIEQPRHIEIQVLADQFGAAVHLFERECSVQRRNQKVIEEAPSTFLDEKTRKAMGRQAVALAQAVDYVSAGTVEFIVDKDRNFYFLEMNTRLQVEHPVTELITGIDLVEEMIRVAAGEPLRYAQKDIKRKGWAIEARIYAEDPERKFLPSTGRLKRYRPPAEKVTKTDTVRVDTGVFEGGEISVFYDPMIAKLITHSADRKAATQSMSRALDRFYIDGISHNIPFLAALMQHPRWKSGDINTNLIADEYPDGFALPEPSGRDRDVLMVVAAAADHVRNQRRRMIDQQMPGEDVSFTATRVVDLAGTSEKVLVQGELGDLMEITLLRPDGSLRESYTVETRWWPGQPVWEGKLNNVDEAVKLKPLACGMQLAAHGVGARARVLTEREAELMTLMPIKLPPDMSKYLLCPMPGIVTSVLAVAGDEVVAGQALCIIEAMKMENTLRAERDGRVAKVNAKPGDAMAVDAVIMTFEDPSV